MNIIDIFCVHFLTPDGKNLSIGGIETYVLNLVKLADSLKIEVRIFQFSAFNFQKRYGNAQVYGIRRGKHLSFNSLYKLSLSTRNRDNNYVNIIANDTLIPSWKVPNSIVIQHGIGFDDESHPRAPFLVTFIYRMLKSYKRIKRIQNVDEIICVDNNYICWYRTQTPRRNVRLMPILNFAALPEVNREKVDSSTVKIVFARRFVQIRGTRLFGPVAKRLLEKYDNIEISFAGEGPEESYLRSLFKNEDRVVFTHYNSLESIPFHQQFDISVVPTIYSEGTSLSLLEAMSAGCAVVCTNIGGMTNIIIDGYNGLMVSPRQDELYEAISRLIDDKILRKRLSTNAQLVVKESFSLERWNRQWKKVICDKFEK